MHRRGESYLGDLANLFEPRWTHHPMHALLVVAIDPIFHKSRWQRLRNRRSA
ncbi:hypothetical protein KCH_66250 [Kitasatospora cheerisanensis KCTC 2395]|uniref:Uncharacterized protein n=1 Tax=Kitasatospora cheerisanensis KCTC 2395 TaxID=1348663 RepID=A0A066YJF8_9ACTN|nr:hypothetical protein KCH_66250 [Kitasatospora cheerisanensis KCTC 2395]